ncbi:pheromone A receptor-domain-containing protein [Mycena leptocephala]|nr:pheromone A receptor-domain-containing protein [Mycena leptocephala]
MSADAASLARSCVTEAWESTRHRSQPLTRCARAASRRGEHKARHLALSRCASGIEARESAESSSWPWSRRASRRGSARTQPQAFVSSCVEARESTNRSSWPFSRRRRGAGEHEAQLPAIVPSRRRRARIASPGHCIVEARESTRRSSRPLYRRGVGEHELQLLAVVSSRRGRARIAAPGPSLVGVEARESSKRSSRPFVSSWIEARESTNYITRPLYRRAWRRGRARSASPGLSPRTDVSGYVGLCDVGPAARRLHQIASVRTVTKTRAEERRVFLIDLAIGLGIPLLCVRRLFPARDLEAAHRLPRRDLQDPVSVFLFHLPPILIGALLAVYCVLSIKSFYNSRSQFRLLLSASTNKNLNLSRYTDLLTTPLGMWVLCVNVRVCGLSPWVSWADTHSNFSRVVQVPSIYWRADPYSTASAETLRWATVVCVLLFFAYFRFADEAIKNYRVAFNSMARRVGYTMAGSASGLSSTGASSKSLLSSSSRGASATLPVFIRKDTTQKRDSFDSFCDTDLSASYGGISPLDYDVEKALAFGEDGAGREKGTLMLGDVSGMLPEYKVGDYSSSPTSSSASSDTESVGGKGEEEAEIEVLYLHRASVHIPIPTTLAPAEPAHMHIQRASADVPVLVVDTADIV